MTQRLLLTLLFINNNPTQPNTNMNSDVMQQWRTHTLPFQQEKDSIVVFGLGWVGLSWVELGWVVVNEKQGKQESLSHYRIIMDMHNVANQKALQDRKSVV